MHAVLKNEFLICYNREDPKVFPERMPCPGGRLAFHPESEPIWKEYLRVSIIHLYYSIVYNKIQFGYTNLSFLCS